MKIYFNDLRPIRKSEFFSKFDEHISKRKKPDEMEKIVFQDLKDNSSFLTFYIGMLNEMGIENLILPHHSAEDDGLKDPDRTVKEGGEKICTVIEDYNNKFIPNKRFPKGTDKIQKQKSRFFNNDNSILKADFLAVCNQREWAHRGHYDITHGNSKIYICNGFHRLVAYGLWICENGFKPLELYYAHYTSN